MLSKEQRQLMFRGRYKEHLENEVIKATVGKEEFRLQFVDVTTLPDNWRTLRDVALKSTTQEDWRNLLALVEGIHNSHMAVRPEFQAFVIRKLAAAGQIDLMLAALRRVESTGVSLQHYPVLGCTLLGLFHAGAPKWELEQVEKLLKIGEGVLELLEHPLHGGGRKVTENDLRTRPTVLAPVLFFAAVKAFRQGGQDEGDKARIYADRILSMWSQGAKVCLLSQIVFCVTI